LTSDLHTYNVINYTYEEEAVKAILKRKNYYLNENKIRRAKAILGAKTETETIDAALDLIVFRKEILKSLEKVAGRGGVEKVF
jgi:DnaJ-class molecular chaperone